MREEPKPRSAPGSETADEVAHRSGIDLLSDAATEVVGAPDPLGVLDSICRSALKLVRAQGACAHLFDRLDHEVSEGLTATAGDVCVSEVTAEPHIASVRDRVTAEHLGTVEADGQQIVVPLTTSEGNPIGGICLWAPMAATAPSGDAVFSQLLRLAGVALEKATQLEYEHRLVLELQRSLLPRTVPKVPGATVSARYRPASVGVDVGGDWYDIFALPAGKFAFVLGDVAGHGVHAASIMGQVRMALRAYAMETEDPAEVVSRLNRLMTQLHTSEFTTLILCIWDPPTRTAQLVRAGHLPPLLVGEDGAALVETTGSVPIGVDMLSTYATDRIVVEPGTALMLFSDGLVERRGESLDAGLARLTALANEFDGHLDGLCDRLLANLAGRAIEDDVALLGIMVEATSAERIRFDLNADQAGLPDVWERLGNWLHEHGASDRESEELLAMARETAADAVERSTPDDATRLRITAAIVGRSVDIVIEDVHPGEEDITGPHTRGLALMRSLSDSFEVRHHRQGAAIVIRRRIREDDESARDRTN